MSVLPVEVRDQIYDLIKLAFKARAKLGLRGVADLSRAVGCTRQMVYRTLSPAEIKELGR